MIPKPANAPARRFDLLLMLLPIAAVAAFFQWRVVVESGGFWLDEIFSASYVGLGPLDAVVAILRFDVHPPLYYLQLDAWGALFGAGDTALLANSLLWSLIGLISGSLWLGRRHGRLPALLFALLFAGLGAVLFYVAELRMYTLMMALTLLGLTAGDRFRADGSGGADAWRLAGVLIVLGAVHSAAAVVVSSLLLYALPWPHHAADGQVRALKRWLLVAAGVGLTMLPWIANAALRNVGHIGLPTFDSLLQIVGGLLLGHEDRATDALRRLAGAVGLLVLLIGVIRPPTRRLALSLIVWPFAFTAAVSLLWKPLWYYREYAFVAGPLAAVIALQLAAAVRSLGAGLGRQLAAAIAWLAVGALGCWNLQATRHRPPASFVELAQAVDAQVADGEYVYSPDNRTLWGLGRYLIGPDWGNLLDVQDPDDQDRSRIWPKVYARLGPVWRERLHLVGTGRRLDGWRAPLYIGWSPLPALDTVDAYWLVVPLAAGEADLPTPPPRCFDPDAERIRLSAFELIRVRCPAARTTMTGTDG